MAAPHDAPGRAGTRVLALVLAVFFLAVIGGSAGYILGLRHKHAQRLTDRTTVDPGATPTTASPQGSDNTRGSGDKACLSESERDVKAKFGSPGGLVQVFYLKTDRSEVWICRDSGNALFYQGHVRSSAEQQGGPRPPLVDLKNSLLLKGPRPEGDGWVAENDSGSTVTRYHASPDELVIEQPGKSADHQRAIYHEP
jgi:hypothetical protein